MSIVTFRATDLKVAFDAVAPAVQRTAILPVLTMVRVTRDALTANSMELCITAPVNGDGDDIDICIPADQLRMAIQAASDSVTITIPDPKKFHCEVRAGRSRFRAPFIPGAEMPVPDLPEVNATFSSDEAFGGELGRVLFSAGVKDVRYYLNGVLLDSLHGTLTAVATDGNRATKTVLGDTDEDFQFIVPRHLVDTLAKLPPSEWEVRGNMLVAISEGRRVVAKGIDHKFPDWRRLMKPFGTNDISVSRAALLSAVSLTKPLRDEVQRARVITLTSGEDGELTVAASTAERVAETKIPIESLTGDPLSIALDADFLDGLLRSLTAEIATFTYKDGTTAIYTCDGEYESVLMPRRQ